MHQKLSAEFEIASWKETTQDEFPDGRKLNLAAMQYRYSGGLIGESTSHMLLDYGAAAGPCHFAVYEHFVGVLAGPDGERQGGFVLQGIGVYAQGVAKTVSTIVPGSGTGELTGIEGRVLFAAGHEDRYPVELEYGFGAP